MYVPESAFTPYTLISAHYISLFSGRWTVQDASQAPSDTRRTWLYGAIGKEMLNHHPKIRRECIQLTFCGETSVSFFKGLTLGIVCHGYGRVDLGSRTSGFGGESGVFLPRRAEGIIADPFANFAPDTGQNQRQFVVGESPGIGDSTWTVIICYKICTKWLTKSVLWGEQVMATDPPDLYL